MKRSRVLSVAAAGLALSLAASACGGDDDKEPGTGSSAPGAAAKFDAGSTAVVNPSDKKGGVLKVGMSDDFDSTDPGNLYYAFGLNFSRLYSRPLMTYASKPGVEGNKAVPDLAEAPGVASDGNKTWTYKLKKGLKYEDGTEIKAIDVKNAVARTFDRGVLGKGPSYFIQFLDAGDYKGSYKEKDLSKFTAVETPDDYTVVFKLKSAFPEFDYIAALPQTAPVPQAKDTGARYALHPFSSGPYKWDGDYKPKSGGALVPNTNWDASTDPNRKQLPERIEVSAGIAAEEVDNRLFNGTLHVDLAGSGVQTAGRQKIVTDPKLKANSDNPVAGFHWYLPINSKNVPNIECRKAIIFAANRDAMWRAYGAEYGGEMSTSLTPPSIPGRQANTLYPAQPGYKGDETKAKAALAACGKPTGFDLNMAFRSDRPKEKATAEAIQASLKKVGINVTLKGYPAGTYTGEQVGSPAFMKKENIGLATYGWAADWPSGFGYMQPLTDGKAIVDSGNSNVEELNDPEINKLWQDVTAVADPAEREKIYAQIDQKVMEQAVILPNVYAKSLLFRPTTLANVYYHPYYGMYDYAVLGVTG